MEITISILTRLPNCSEYDRDWNQLNKIFLLETFKLQFHKYNRFGKMNKFTKKSQVTLAFKTSKNLTIFTLWSCQTKLKLTLIYCWLRPTNEEWLFIIKAFLLCYYTLSKKQLREILHTYLSQKTKILSRHKYYGNWTNMNHCLTLTQYGKEKMW